MSKLLSFHNEEAVKANEDKLRLPEWLAQLEDYLFDGLSKEDAKTFPQQFLEAIPVGRNLEPVRWKFCAFILKENIERVLLLNINSELKTKVVDAIKQCLKIHEDAILSGIWSESAAQSARVTAWSAAKSAARSSAESAESAAWSAWSAAGSGESAESAARCAWSAAESAAETAESAAYKRYADELLRLLREE
jgi:hypothetical protein